MKNSDGSPKFVSKDKDQLKRGALISADCCAQRHSNKQPFYPLSSDDDKARYRRNLVLSDDFLAGKTFAEQARLMRLMAIVIAALFVLVLRIAIGANKDETLSLLSNNDPGRITCNAGLFANRGTYVLPLVGVLAALLFETTDLFRSVLGPILRLFA